MKIRPVIRDKWLVPGILLFCLSVCGCTGVYQLDLEKQRKQNLVEDMELLSPRKEMRFPDPLTLSDVIRIGLENNLDMRISRIMEDIADDEALSEKLKMLPNMDAQADYSRRNKYNISWYEDVETGERVMGSSTNQEKESKSMSISLSWNILDFGLSYIRARQSAMGAEIKRLERIRQAQTLALDIASAYWQVILSEKDLQYIKKLEAEVAEYKKRADEMVAQRRLDPIAAKGMDKQLISLAIAANNLQADISGAKIRLAELMGVTPMTEFELAQDEPFDKYLEDLPNPEKLDPMKLEMISLNNRPELYASDIQQKVQQDEARAALVSMFPGIRFDIGSHYNGNTYLVNKSWVTVGAGIAYDILSLPAQYMSWKSKEKSIDMVKAERLLLTAGIIAQVHMSLHDYVVKKQQYELYDTSHTIAQDLLSMSRQQHEVGTVSDTVIIQRMMESMLSRLERDRSIIDLLNTYNTLLVTLGLEYGRWNQGLDQINEMTVPVEMRTGQAEGDYDIRMGKKDETIGGKMSSTFLNQDSGMVFAVKQKGQSPDFAGTIGKDTQNKNNTLLTIDKD